MFTCLLATFVSGMLSFYETSSVHKFILHWLTIELDNTVSNNMIIFIMYKSLILRRIQYYLPRDQVTYNLNSQIVNNIRKHCKSTCMYYLTSFNLEVYEGKLFGLSLFNKISKVSNGSIQTVAPDPQPPPPHPTPLIAWMSSTVHIYCLMYSILI